MPPFEINKKCAIMQMRKDLPTKILMVALFKMKNYPPLPKPRVPIIGLYKLLYTYTQYDARQLWKSNGVK